MGVGAIPAREKMARKSAKMIEASMVVGCDVEGKEGKEMRCRQEGVEVRFTKAAYILYT